MSASQAESREFESRLPLQIKFMSASRAESRPDSNRDLLLHLLSHPLQEGITISYNNPVSLCYIRAV